LFYYTIISSLPPIFKYTLDVSHLFFNYNLLRVIDLTLSEFLW